MRLIDADAFKNLLNSGSSESVDINISKTMPLGEIVDIVIQAYRKCLFAELEKMPTAYDKDKVIENMENMSERYAEFAKPDTAMRPYHRGVSDGYKFSIRIVKGGGVSE